jgi:hypothetical protein
MTRLSIIRLVNAYRSFSFDIDTEVRKFARPIQLIWPDEIYMLWGEKGNSHYLPSTA